MPEEIRIWRVGTNGTLTEVQRSRLDFEQRLEDWLAADISVLSPDLLVIGRQVSTAYGGSIDLLCLDSGGDLVVVELKRDKTPREITAQVLDYASWVRSQSYENVRTIWDSYAGRSSDLEEAFGRQFDADLPEVLNSSHRMLIVGSLIDDSSERIIRYLSETYGVPINAATFQYFREGANEFVARVFMMEPDEVTPPPSGKRRPKVPPEEILAQLSDSGYREALQGILAEAENSKLFVEKGEKGFSVRRRVNDRPTPISVAWFFPPGVVGWYSLADFTLGRERKPSIQWSAEHETILAAFARAAEGIPGAERVPSLGLDGFRFRPDVVKAQTAAISALLRHVAHELGPDK